MPKTNGNKKQKATPEAAVVLQPETKFRALYNLQPWNCVHHADHSIIEAYVMAKGDWETVAEVKNTAHINAEETAGFIARAVNDYEHNRALIKELVAALELCLECEGITWEVEQEAEIVLRRAKEAIR